MRGPNASSCKDGACEGSIAFSTIRLQFTPASRNSNWRFAPIHSPPRSASGYTLGCFCKEASCPSAPASGQTQSRPWTTCPSTRRLNQNGFTSARDNNNPMLLQKEKTSLCALIRNSFNRFGSFSKAMRASPSFVVQVLMIGSNYSWRLDTCHKRHCNPAFSIA